MNATLTAFGYPASLIADYTHWVVLIRPRQVTLGCAVIAAKSGATSFGELTAQEAAEWPAVVKDFEATLRALFGARKFNYLALMMVDPNPHYHAIPRYAGEACFLEQSFCDPGYPRAPHLDTVHDISTACLESLRRALRAAWPHRSPV